MDGMTLLGMVLVFGAGFSGLALTLRLLDPARSPVAQEAGRRASEGVRTAETAVAAMPAFFARPQMDPASATSPQFTEFDEALLALLQSYVKAERAMAREFVQLPSIDSLYRQARTSPTLH